MMIAIIGTNGGELLGEIPAWQSKWVVMLKTSLLTIHAHPTLHESVGLAAEVFEGSVTDLPNQKRRRSNFRLPEHPAIKKRLTTPLFFVCNLPFQSSAPRSEDVRILLTVCSLFNLTVWLLSFRR